MAVVSPKEFAAAVGVTVGAVNRAITNGRIQTCGMIDKRTRAIDLESQKIAWQETTDFKSVPHNLNGGRPRKDGTPTDKPLATNVGEPKSPKLADITLAREATKLKLDQLKLREAEGELIKVDYVRSELAKLAGTVKSALLNIPERVSAELAGMNDPHDIHTLLTREINQAMVDLSEGKFK